MSMRNVLQLSVENLLQLYSLSASFSAEAAYPLPNLQSPHANMPAVWDMSSASSVVIEGTGGVERIASCFAVWNHNMPLNNTVRLLLYPSAGYSGSPFDTGAMPVTTPAGTSLKACESLFFEAVTFRSFRVVINAPSSVNNVLSIDKLWLGEAHAFQYGADPGSRFGIVDRSVHQRKPGGGMETTQFECYRVMQTDIRMHDSEAQIVRRLLDRAKKGGDVFVSADPHNEHGMQFDNTGIFRRSSDLDFTAQYFNGHSFGLALEEN